MPFAAATWIDVCAAEQPRTLRCCNPDFSYPPTHTHTRLTLKHTPRRALTHMPPYASLPSPLVSMMCAVEMLAHCQRRSAWLRSERRADAEGFDSEAELKLMVGWWDGGGSDTQPTTAGHAITDRAHVSTLVHVSMLRCLQRGCLGNVYPRGCVWRKSPWGFFIAVWLVVRSQFVWQDWRSSLDCVPGCKHTPPRIGPYFTSALGKGFKNTPTLNSEFMMTKPSDLTATK